MIHQEQLIEAGMTRAAIRHRLATGRLVEIERRTHLIAGAELTYEARCQAALLAAGDAAVLSHFTALALRGIVPQGPLHVSSRRAVRQLRMATTHRTPSLTTSEIETHRGLRLTSVARAILDLAPSALSDRQLTRIVREATRGHTTLAAIGQTLDSHPRQRGSKRLRAIVESYTPGIEQTESDLEVLLLDLCGLYDLPIPDLQVETVLPNGAFIRIDAYWEHAGVACELDDSGHQLDIPFVEDRTRDLNLTVLGVRPIRLTRLHLTAGAHETAIALGAILSRGSPTPLPRGPERDRATGRPRGRPRPVAQ